MANIPVENPNEPKNIQKRDRLNNRVILFVVIGLIQLSMLLMCFWATALIL